MTAKDLYDLKETAKKLVDHTKAACQGKDLYGAELGKLSKLNLRMMMCMLDIFAEEGPPTTGWSKETNELIDGLRGTIVQWDHASTEDRLWVVLTTGMIAKRGEK